MRLAETYIRNIASELWTQAGKKGKPPYDLSGAIGLLFPIDIVHLSELTLARVTRWFNDRHITIQTDANDRPLHGFVAFHRGAGFMFINGADDERERRFTIAHELAHFLLDYQIPRDAIIAKLGPEIKDALDGLRPPTPHEQILGIINFVRVKPFTHILEKNGDGSFDHQENYDAENNADDLALEILAPANEVIGRVRRQGKNLPFDAFHKTCVTLLEETYCLPLSVAEPYASRLACRAAGSTPLLSRYLP